ncbi:MAG: STAS domain-containing protein [Victivallaceae bacterium]|nr:STAS domain-containing protein [Victivallaceae bacterium]
MKLTQLESVDQITHLLLSGSMDVAGVREIEMDFSRLASGKQPLVLDFSGVTFIASLGMRMLLSAAKKLDNEGHKIVLHSVPPLVETALHTAGLSTVLPIVKNEPDAFHLLLAQK